MKINVGFGRSTAQKAVSSANKHYLDWSKEHNINHEITDFSTHFIDRVLGQTSTSHEGMRLGTTIEQLKDSIANPRKLSEPYYVPVKKAE